MEGSCTDESTTSESISLSGGAVVSLSPKAFSAFPPVPESVCRVGSGSSVIMDESGVEAESRKLPSSKYKGVVPQPNGRWGAQIYEKHQRVWLGTFNEEDEAARAYDIAAQRFRGRDAITNFKTKKHQSSNTTTTTELNDVDEDIESAFLNSHSKAEIVDMLRKHTYDDELEQSKRHLRKNLSGRPATAAEKLQNSSCTLNGAVPKAREQLFEKAVTPSDVGKLNRLVIPKQHAEKHFPLQNINGNKNVNNSTKGVLLNFEDVSGKVWRFRYSYWNSSQSYVLTKGWSRFVKEKNLKAGDVVCFQRSTNGDKQLYIDWKARAGGNCPPVQVQVQPVQMVRLFGVNIFKVPAATGGCNNIGKRSRSEMELLNLEYSAKKQRVIGAL